MISHTHCDNVHHCPSRPTRTPFQQRPSDGPEALTWPCTSTWTHVWSGHQTHSWNSRQRTSQKWLDGHCHMWPRFCVSTWGCSAFSIDHPNKSQWREKRRDGRSRRRKRYTWMTRWFMWQRGREQTERGMKHHFMTLTSVLLQLRVTFHCFRTKSLLT